ncbi:unnamed protein product [Closterium sp. Naga37s-1]|nr:unnamed protein product [Closterium sp. Naga37s-1]
MRAMRGARAPSPVRTRHSEMEPDASEGIEEHHEEDERRGAAVPDADDDGSDVSSVDEGFDTLTEMYIFFRDADLSRREVNRLLTIFSNPRFSVRDVRRWLNYVDVRRFGKAMAPPDLVPWLKTEIKCYGPGGKMARLPLHYRNTGLCFLERWNFADTEWGNVFLACVADILHVLDGGMLGHLTDIFIKGKSKPERREFERTRANYAAFETRGMMQVMPILIADSMDGCKPKDVEQRTKEVRAFRKYAMFYKALVGVAKHTEQTLRHVRTAAYAMMDAIGDAFPDQKSSWNFPKVHQIVHLIDAIPLRGMPWEYSTNLWEHTHKGTVKVPAVRLQGHILTRRSRCANVRNEEDPVLWVYHEAFGSDMDGLGRCLIDAGVNAPDIKVHTALAIPRTRGGELVAKGTFVKASPSEKWFSDVAVKAEKKEKEKENEWYARCLCVFRAKNAEGEEGAYVYVKYYEAAGLCPVTTCVQLTPGRVDTRYAVVDVECIKRVVHVCKSYVNKKVLLLNKFLLCE